MIDKVFFLSFASTGFAGEELLATVVNGEIDGPCGKISENGRAKTSIESTNAIVLVNDAKCANETFIYTLPFLCSMSCAYLSSICNKGSSRLWALFAALYGFRWSDAGRLDRSLDGALRLKFRLDDVERACDDRGD